MAGVIGTWFAVAGHGPAVQALLVVLGTFVLEDAATVLTGMAVQAGEMRPATGLLSLYSGIVLGDMGLYGLGALAARVPWARRWAPPERLQAGTEWMRRHLAKTVFVSRFLPGARLPTYTACGFLGADFARFVLATAGATLIWTTGLFAASMWIGKVLLAHLGAWRWVGMAGTALTVAGIGAVAARVRRAS